jgi:hypothetical protein
MYFFIAKKKTNKNLKIHHTPASRFFHKIFTNIIIKKDNLLKKKTHQTKSFFLEKRKKNTLI